MDGTLYQNAGATIPQELAYSLAHANEYLNHISITETINKEQEIQFLISEGSNYFLKLQKSGHYEYFTQVLLQSTIFRKTVKFLRNQQNAIKPCMITMLICFALRLKV